VGHATPPQFYSSVYLLDAANLAAAPALRVARSCQVGVGNGASHRHILYERPSHVPQNHSQPIWAFSIRMTKAQCYSTLDTGCQWRQEIFPWHHWDGDVLQFFLVLAYRQDCDGQIVIAVHRFSDDFYCGSLLGNQTKSLIFIAHDKCLSGLSKSHQPYCHTLFWESALNQFWLMLLLHCWCAVCVQ